MENEEQATARSVVMLLRRVAGDLPDEGAAHALFLNSLAIMDSMTALRIAADRGPATLPLANSGSFE